MSANLQNAEQPSSLIPDEGWRARQAQVRRPAGAKASSTPRSSRGQILIIFVFAIIGLIAITGLAVDGGQIYSDRRQAQNAADTAALAGAVTKVNYMMAPHNAVASDCANLTGAGPCGPAVLFAAQDMASKNGFTGNITDNQVEVHVPPIDGPYSGDTDYIEVIISTNVNTYFARVLGIRQLHNRVEAVALAIPASEGSPFPDDAIVGLDPNGNSFDSGNSAAASWNITGGGIFANDDAYAKRATSVTFSPGYCVTAVGTASTFGCTVSSNNPGLKLQYPTDITPLLPPIPPCDGNAVTGSDGKIHEQAGKEGRGSVVSGFDHQYAPGLYCITNAGGNIHNVITGSGVTFFITDTSFTMKYNGGGAFAAQAPTSGTYAGVLMFSAVTPSTCTQNVEIRGNGSTPIVGTIFMPSACIDWRGNGTAGASRSQLIGYDITSNGNADVAFSYNAADNYKQHIQSQLGIVQ